MNGLKITLFDVVAVDVATGEERHMVQNVTGRDAEAVARMAIMRRGVDTQYYKTVPAGTPLVSGEKA